MKPEPCQSPLLLCLDPQRPFPVVVGGVPCPSPLAMWFRSHCSLVHSDCLKLSWQVGHERINKTDPGRPAAPPDLWTTAEVEIRVRTPKTYFWCQAGGHRGRFTAYGSPAAAVSLLRKTTQLLRIRPGPASKLYPYKYSVHHQWAHDIRSK